LSSILSEFQYAKKFVLRAIIIAIIMPPSPPNRKPAKRIIEVKADKSMDVFK